MQERRPPQILVVEDLPEHRDIYRSLLEHRGYRVAEAEDGEEAMRLVERERPDLILMDVRLPWMDGWEVTRRLKAVPRTATIPVVAISADPGADGERRAVESGCAGLLAKTDDPAALVARVEALVGPSGA